MATLSLHVVDKRHARLLQHVADAWDLRETIRAHAAASPDAIVSAGQEAIDHTETAAHRALDDVLREREWLVVRRDITWWRSPEGDPGEVDEVDVDWSRMDLVDRVDLRAQAEQIVAEGSLTDSFVVRAEALVLPAFEDGP